MTSESTAVNLPSGEDAVEHPDENASNAEGAVADHIANGDDAAAETVSDGEDADDAAEETPLSRLEEEGDVAADYLEELLDIADIDGDIDIEVRNGRSYLSVVGDDEAEGLDILVGNDGEVLEALQELTRLSVLAATGNRSRLVLDISGYRGERSVRLQEIAEKAVERVKAGERSVHLEPMSSYERKIVHDSVAELGFGSESEGEGAARHIVVSAD
ncbi:R3H domain-containing nucleic acid-binding protein [Sinomonas sp. ASV486]|uniref:Jag family protein n=1 Tax=Sinomonas sp. ASV486 TaxID=3051170 RepID=UPI0027DC429C|nr:R3H domain-containing nucleic acid-binding protein [Sinomonas sp. ASV486]MDQ4491803.1 R3H domain-containing nucleic acid-binding protein [Sinomonas sp. ASV486]